MVSVAPGRTDIGPKRTWCPGSTVRPTAVGSGPEHAPGEPAGVRPAGASALDRQLAVSSRVAEAAPGARSERSPGRLGGCPRARGRPRRERKTPWHVPWCSGTAGGRTEPVNDSPSPASGSLLSSFRAAAGHTGCHSFVGAFLFQPNFLHWDRTPDDEKHHQELLLGIKG